MKCTYHPTNLASARCSSCDRNLCPACDHRIKGYPYCQDCIVAGIELLRHNPTEKTYLPQTEGKSPFLALVLGLIPGLGAAYNGQPVKALVHFVVTAGLWTLADVFHNTLEMTCALASFAVYVYSLYDAFRSAQRQRQGANLAEEDEQLRQFMRARTNLWGGLLIAIGVLTTLHIIFPVQTHRFWPLLLVAAGIYLLSEFRRSKNIAPPAAMYRTPPPSVIQPELESPTRKFAGADHRFDR
ncbi:MAG: B-box zinc finger protein [Acidobacteria bacterium]|nr:B-box zinc finger protein [Acidobacteriota bacterium]